MYVIPSYAKINLMLHVTSKRSDGYHELKTLFQTVSLCDWFHIQIVPTRKIELTSSQENLPIDDSNLIVRAAKILQEKTKTNLGIKIFLEKQIPVGAGLGGGSSNAAVTLIVLNKLWNLNLPVNELHSIAAQLGADVPFFLYGGTAFGTGRGDQIQLLPDLNIPYLLLVNPCILVQTKEIFSYLSVKLTKYEAPPILPACFFPEFQNGRHLNVNDICEYLRNDLEETVFDIYPIVGQAMRQLSNNGSMVARMSGSGATVFGIFENKELQQVAQKSLLTESWKTWCCHSVGRDKYLNDLSI